MSFVNFTVLSGEKYLLGKALERVSHVVNELGSLFCCQSLALSLSEKGKSRSRLASTDTPFSVIVSNFTRNLRRCALGLFDGCLPNWSRSTKVVSVELSSKLLASITGMKWCPMLAVEHSLAAPYYLPWPLPLLSLSFSFLHRLLH